jgi:hypothetical protein
MNYPFLLPPLHARALRSSLCYVPRSPLAGGSAPTAVTRIRARAASSTCIPISDLLPLLDPRLRSLKCESQIVKSRPHFRMRRSPAFTTSISNRDVKYRSTRSRAPFWTRRDIDPRSRAPAHDSTRLRRRGAMGGEVRCEWRDYSTLGSCLGLGCL